MRVACLHTHRDNIKNFQEACPTGIELIHHVRSDFLRRACDNGIDDGLRAELNLQVTRLNRNAEAVLLTCSTLRKAVPDICYSADGILSGEMESRGAGKRFEVFYTNPDSKEPTTELFGQMTAPEETKLSLVDGAWSLFMAGDHSEYMMKIADAANQSDAEIVVFGQSSMTPAVALCNRDVWCIPNISLEWLDKHLQIQAAQ